MKSLDVTALDDEPPDDSFVGRSQGGATEFDDSFAFRSSVDRSVGHNKPPPPPPTTPWRRGDSSSSIDRPTGETRALLQGTPFDSVGAICGPDGSICALIPGNGTKSSPAVPGVPGMQFAYK